MDLSRREDSDDDEEKEKERETTNICKGLYAGRQFVCSVKKRGKTKK